MAYVALGIASMVAVAGCSMDETGVEIPNTVAAQLANPTPLPLDMETSSVVIQGNDLPMLSGQVKLGAYYYKGNQIELDALDVAFDTMIVTGQTPAIEGYELRHARVSLAQPIIAPVEWPAHGDAGFASISAEVLLDWSVVGPTGIEVKLATQHLSVDIELDVYTTADGTLTAVLSGARQGTFWTWAGVASMGDLQFDLRATRVPLAH